MGLIHCKDSNGYEYLKEYDSNGNVVYCKELLYGGEVWQEYDSNGNLIHRKFSNGNEYYFNQKFLSKRLETKLHQAKATH